MMNESDIKFDFSGKRFVVVGASSGMGLQVTRELLANGATVLAVDRNEEKLKEIAAEIGSGIEIHAADVRDPEDLEKGISEFAGKGKINGSVYTAGLSRTTVLRSFSEQDASDMMQVNFWGWVNLMKIISKKKYSEEGCSNVVIASAAAHRGESGNFAYNASKAAIMNTVQTFAKELAKRKCRVNSVSPGFVTTPLTQGYFTARGYSERTIEKHLLGLGTPEDVAGAILYLLSDRAKWITGTDLIIDGGYLISD